MPAYNEASDIVSRLSELCRYLSNWQPESQWRVIVVDDGSTDGTREHVEMFARQHPRVSALAHGGNRGMGAALRTAIAQSQGDVVVTLEADLSYAPSHVGEMVDTLCRTRADMVLASAYMDGGKVASVPALRRWLSRWANVYLRWSTGQRIQTATCVVRACRGDFLRSLRLESDDVEINLELLHRALQIGAKIVEIPAELRWRGTARGRVSRLSWGRIVRRTARVLVWGVRLRRTPGVQNREIRRQQEQSQ